MQHLFDLYVFPVDILSLLTIMVIYLSFIIVPK